MRVAFVRPMGWRCLGCVQRETTTKTPTHSHEPFLGPKRGLKRFNLQQLGPRFLCTHAGRERAEVRLHLPPGCEDSTCTIISEPSRSLSESCVLQSRQLSYVSFHCFPHTTCTAQTFGSVRRPIGSRLDFNSTVKGSFTYSRKTRVQTIIATL